MSRELNTPRRLSFSGVIKARKKEITQWGLADLGTAAETVGVKGSPTIVATLSNLESKRQVQFIAGTREEKAQQLVQNLADAGML